MKTLKQCGIPFGARVVFRLQWLPIMVAAIVMLLSLPFLALWALVHESGLAFIQGLHPVLDAKLAGVKAHRARLVAMYGGEE